MLSSPLLRDVERRIAEFTHLPVENGESFYLLRYDVGQKYSPHHDYFAGAKYLLLYCFIWISERSDMLSFASRCDHF